MRARRARRFVTRGAARLILIRRADARLLRGVYAVIRAPCARCADIALMYGMRRYAMAAARMLLMLLIFFRYGATPVTLFDAHAAYFAYALMPCYCFARLRC